MTLAAVRGRERQRRGEGQKDRVGRQTEGGKDRERAGRWRRQGERGQNSGEMQDRRNG